jgi:hypothetical protein
MNSLQDKFHFVDEVIAVSSAIVVIEKAMSLDDIENFRLKFFTEPTYFKYWINDSTFRTAIFVRFAGPEFFQGNHDKNTLLLKKKPSFFQDNVGKWECKFCFEFYNFRTIEEVYEYRIAHPSAELLQNKHNDLLKQLHQFNNMSKSLKKKKRKWESNECLITAECLRMEAGVYKSTLRGLRGALKLVRLHLNLQKLDINRPQKARKSS